MKEQIPETDQWKLNGNCEKCRRKEYCHTECGASKRATKRRLDALKCDIVDSVFPKWETLSLNKKPFSSYVKEWL